MLHPVFKGRGERSRSQYQIMDFINRSSLESSLPPTVSAFFPVFLAELVLGLVSNGLLLALLVKARSVQSNTSVFLASMVCANALTLIPTTAMMVATMKRTLVLSEGACLTMQMVSTSIQFPNILLHVFISRDRYQVVLHFFEWIPYTRRTCLYIFLVWVLAAALGGAGAFSGGAEGNDTVHPILFCQIPHLHLAYDPRSPYSNAWMALFGLTGLIHFGAAITSILNYSHILRKILAVKGSRAQQLIYPAASNSTDNAWSASLRSCGDTLDAPIEWESEVQSLKSIISAFLLNAVAFLSFYGYYAAILIKSIVERLPFDEVYDPVVLVALVALYVLPIVNPAVFMITNAKFRTRVRGLFDIDCHVPRANDLQRRGSIPVDKRGHDRNKIVPLSTCRNAEAGGIHNTWVTVV